MHGGGRGEQAGGREEVEAEADAGSLTRGEELRENPNDSQSGARQEGSRSVDVKSEEARGSAVLSS